MEVMLIALFLGGAWLLPFFLVLFCDKTPDSDKSGWLFLVLFSSWCGFLMYQLGVWIRPVIKGKVTHSGVNVT